MIEEKETYLLIYLQNFLNGRFVLPLYYLIIYIYTHTMLQ